MKSDFVFFLYPYNQSSKSNKPNVLVIRKFGKRSGYYEKMDMRNDRTIGISLQGTI